jgi:hypothetical protein
MGGAPAGTGGGRTDSMEEALDPVDTVNQRSSAGETTYAGAGGARCVFIVTALVFVIYLLPVVLALTVDHRVPNIIDYDDRIYLARIVDAYYGGSLGNPYLAGHEDAPKYMPELAERVTAAAARVVHVSPFTAAAANRVLLPTLIFLLCYWLGSLLGLADDLAILGGLLTVMMPSVTRSTGAYAGETLGFLRYFSSISPSAYVALLLLALCSAARVWLKPTLARAALAVGTLALLFATPPYFWSFAIGGGILLALGSQGQVRRWLLTSIAAALLIGVPRFLHYWRLNRLPDVRQTLQRMQLMLPTRMPEPIEIFLCVLTLGLAAVVFVSRRRIGAAASFFLAYLVAGAMLLVQCVVTNRQIQDFHFAHCIVPVAYLAVLASGSALWNEARPVFRGAVVLAIFSAGIAIQIAGYHFWKQADQQTEADMYHLDGHIPQTIAWLRGHGSRKVVLASSLDRMEALADFAHVKVYWSPFADQYVITDEEAAIRSRSYDEWQHGRLGKLPFPAQLFVSMRDDCRRDGMRGEMLVYSNAREATCVFALPD